MQASLEPITASWRLNPCRAAMFEYAPQRQMLPLIRSRISLSVG